MEERVNVTFGSGEQAEIVIQGDAKKDSVTIHYPRSGSATLSPEQAYKAAKQFAIDDAAEATRKVADAVVEQRDSTDG